MISPRPLSTPYRELIVKAALAGIPPVWIAAELGTSGLTIRNILSQERARGVDIPHFKSGRHLHRHMKYEAAA